MERVEVLAIAGNTSRRQVSIEKWVDSIVPEGDPDYTTSSDGAVTCNEDDLLLGADAKMMTIDDTAIGEMKSSWDKDGINHTIPIEERSTKLSQLTPVKHNSPAAEKESIMMDHMTASINAHVTKDAYSHVTSEAKDHVTNDIRSHLTNDVQTHLPNDMKDHVDEEMEADAEVDCLDPDCERELSWRTKLAVMGLIHMDSIQSQPEINNKTYTCVDDILQDRTEDPEEILTNLGFVHEAEMDSPVFKVPVRFLKASTQASSSHVKTFLENNPEFKEYLASKGIILDEKLETGNVCQDPSLVFAHVDKYTNLGQLVAYCMAAEVPNRFLLSLAKMFPTLPLFADSAEAGSEFGDVSDVEMSNDRQAMQSYDHSMRRSCDQGGEVGVAQGNTMGHCVTGAFSKAAVTTTAGSLNCSMKKAELADCGLRGCEATDMKNAHVLAACQAEVSIMELCTRTSQHGCKNSRQLGCSQAPHIASPALDSLLDHVTNSSKDSAPRYVTIASDSLPGSDDQFCQCDCTEEQWDYSDVVGFQSENRPKKSFSMPKLQLYHSDEFYSNSNQFPRSETIDFFIYDYDNEKHQLLVDDEVAAFETKFSNSERLTLNETLL